MQFGYVVHHGLNAFNLIVDGECGVVVVFQVDEEDGGNVFADDEVDGVFPVEVKAQTVVVTTLDVVVEHVEHGRIGDVFADGLLVVGDDVDTQRGGEVFAWHPDAVLVVVTFLDAEAAGIG